MVINTTKKVAIILFAALFLAACKTTPKFYPLTTEDVRSYRLETVQVLIEPSEEIIWTKYQREKQNIKEGRPVNYKKPAQYAGLEDDDDSTTTEEEKEVKNPVFLTEEELDQERIIKPLQEAIRHEFSEFMIGSRKVNAKITVKRIKIAKVNGVNTLSANFELIDADTDLSIVKKDYHTINFQAQGGSSTYSGDPIFVLTAVLVEAAVKSAASQIGKEKRFSKMSKVYAESLRKWMAPNL